jgi:hypothetical protein
MDEHRNPEERNRDEIRISNRISGIAFALIGLLSLVAAVAYVASSGTNHMTPRGGMPMMGAGVTPAAQTVTVAMRDPGCHWFQVGSAYQKSLSVQGPVNLLNDDEAALKVAGTGDVKSDAVGQQVALSPGTYTITMVGQAPDDNTLHLAVQ